VTHDALIQAADSEGLFATLTNLGENIIANDNLNGTKCETA
jgi:hypothetical protein